MSDDVQMTFTEHLAELRIRILRCFIAVAVGFCVCFAASNQIVELLMKPVLEPLAVAGLIVGDNDTPHTDSAGHVVKPNAVTVQVLSPIEPFLVNIRVAAYGGLLLAFPYIVYQLCAFVFPGLKPREKKAVMFLLTGSSILVVLGVSLAYFAVFPLAMPVLMRYAPSFVLPNLRMSETLGLMSKGLLGFALAFQFPMVVFILVYLGLLHPIVLRKWRRVSIIILLLVSAFFTPQDPWTMFMMAGPLMVLYELSIWISYLIIWRRDKRSKPA